MTIGHGIEDTPSIIHDVEFAREGKKYSELTGLEKRDYLFDEGIRPTAYENFKDEKRPDAILGIRPLERSTFTSLESESLSETLTYTSDEFREPKTKLVHASGSTAKIIFVPEPDTPYTGILSERAHGLARFSFAGPVAAVGVVPALALKFPVDGDHRSENLVLLHKLDRQQPLHRFFSKDSHNSVFQNPLTNLLPTPRVTNLIIRAMNARFQTVVEEGKGLVQTLGNLTDVHTNGTPVEAGRVKTPYRIIFRPTELAVESSDPTIDFRDDLARNIKAGTPIYDVFALTEAQETDLNRAGATALAELLAQAQRIGAITTESEFIASKYGDYRLFFKHNDQFILDRFKK